MTIIDQRGERPACDRCHRVRVKIKRGTICEGCRETDRQAHSRAVEMANWARAYRASVRVG